MYDISYTHILAILEDKKINMFKFKRIEEILDFDYTKPHRVLVIGRDDSEITDFMSHLSQTQKTQLEHKFPIYVLLLGW